MFVPNGPTEAGFLLFIRQVMAIPVEALPDDSPVIPLVYNTSLEVVYLVFACYFPNLYELAVYNLAGSRLLYYAPDQAGSTYFADRRAKLQLNTFIAGVISESHDESTGQTIAVSDSLKNLTIGDLMNLRDPYGRAYMAIAQDAGTLWGLT